MKQLLILAATMAALSWPSVTAPKTSPTDTPVALRTCLGSPLFISIGDSLIYCDQAGTIFQDVNDLTTRGLLKTQMLSQNF